MPRALIVLLAAGFLLVAGQTASAQYYGPVDPYEAPPPFHDYGGYRPYDDHGGYRPYDAQRYFDHQPYYDGPQPYDEIRPYSAYGGPYDRGRHGGPYGHYDPRYHGYDDYPDDRVLNQEEAGNVRKRDQGFDPRRPHLGDGTDVQREQFYPRRPRSCGEYFYWDGRACVDARKYPPYVGPKP